MAKDIIRIGLDVDGVLLYNPARVVRPLVSGLKKLTSKSKKTKFYIPHSPAGQALWRAFHKSSLWIAPGFWRLAEYETVGKVEIYLITGRYSFLKDDLLFALDKYNVRQYVKKVIHNAHDEQPYLFKERVIRELRLDLYIEDNWDVVKHIAPAVPDTRIYWIGNILDRRIPYQYKHKNLYSAVSAVVEDFNL